MTEKQRWLLFPQESCLLHLLTQAQGGGCAGLDTTATKRFKAIFVKFPRVCW